MNATSSSRLPAPFLVLLLAVVAFSTTTTSSALAFPTTSTISNTPVVICPGFGNDQIDYYEPLQQPREVGLVAVLEHRGFDPALISTVPVQRRDWIRVAGGLLDFNFYTNKALPTGNGYGWYLKRFKETVDEAYAKSGGERVLVLGHSAGGWLARAGMGDGVWTDRAEDESGPLSSSSSSLTRSIRTAERICGLTTIGAIHKAPISVASCVTRGALAYTDAQYPGAFLKDEGIGYVSVGGDAIFGDNSKAREEVDTEADRAYATRGEGSAARVAYTSYEAVCGQGAVTGDGVVPLEWTKLEGAKHLRLEGVLHSINEAGTTIPTDSWYGSEKVIDRWLPATLRESGIEAGRNSQSDKNAGFDLDGLKRWASEVFPQS